MFSWIGSRFDMVLSGYVLQVVPELMRVLAPLIFTAMTLWLLIFGWAVLRNEVHETVPTMLWKTVKIGFIVSLASQASHYIDSVSETANALSMGVASTFIPAGMDPAVATTPYQLLDLFSDEANRQLSEIMMEAGITRTDLLLAALVFSFGSVIFTCVALFVITLAKVILTFVVAIGPLFILCLAWRPTQRFFDSWLSMVLNAVVLTWMAFFSLGISTFMGNSILQAIQAGGGFLGENFNVLGESVRYCILMLMMAIICFQAPGFAAALTGGAVVQQGVQMLQSAMIASGARSASSFAKNDASSTGGAISRGTGASYQAGRLAGRAAVASGRAASSAASTAAAGAGYAARQGVRAVKTAAYKVAALKHRDY
jgi:type IV secretion system protein VirB6